MKPLILPLLGLLMLAGCNRPGNQTEKPSTLPEARKGFVTKLPAQTGIRHPVDTPPAGVFQVVKYASPAGNMSAYLSPDPKDGKKRPAIIWITGGDCNSIGEGCWEEGPADGDESACQYRKAGIMMMFPALRGGNTNPGFKEGYYGEVEDVLAAADFLAKQEYVDPARIYLGGHSTGGTLALLVAECSDRFRAVFSFGPVDDVSGYPAEFLPFNHSNRKEVELRSPGYWLSGIKSPVFVLEGGRKGNIECLQNMSRATSNPNVHFLPVNWGDHFSILAPMNRLLAEKILQDDGPESNLTLTEEDVKKPQAANKKQKPKAKE
ncbi:alpha/beta hydrolase family protein [Zavarzinella formosa]|uniref:alpha/beta hydrolase family protein n=1 Tax=Zavarzinella formosa TaxID=360055 RepID=UPI0002F37F69|nr:prolyl oligopeptidase family serine peptidase [Zavarzinella formosa]